MNLKQFKDWQVKYVVKNWPNGMTWIAYGLSKGNDTITSWPYYIEASGNYKFMEDLSSWRQWIFRQYAAHLVRVQRREAARIAKRKLRVGVSSRTGQQP